MKNKKGIPLSNILKTLQDLAPLELAEGWDNTGLLIGPTKPRPITSILLTLDLTMAVLEEALREKTDMIIAYHPPIFEPIKALTRNDPKGRLVLQAIQANLAVYSPHTALDTVDGGLTDWLCEGVGNGTHHPIYSIEKQGIGTKGPGRVLTLDTPLLLTTIRKKLKKHLGIKFLRAALSSPHKKTNTRFKKVALCPGAGSSVLQDVQADLYVTGEMRHHDVLTALESGISVLLCEHAQSERGYLPIFKRKLEQRLGHEVRTKLATSDFGPLQIM